MRRPSRAPWVRVLLVLLAVTLALPLVAGPAGIAGPAAAASPTAAAAMSASAVSTARRRWIDATIAGMTLEQKVGQLFVQHVYGATATTRDPRNMDLYGVATPAEVVSTYHLGGVIYFTYTGNITTPAIPSAVARMSNGLQRAAMSRAGGLRVAPPLLVAADQETGGLVARLGEPATQMPGAMALGAARDLGLTRDAFRIAAEELAAVGINTDDAPDADVNVDPANPVIGVRSFASRPYLVASEVVSAIGGLHAGGTATVAKHFPGHGDTDTDSHTGLPVITHTRDEWERIDAPPFRAAIAAGTDAIMTAHIVFPSLDPSGDPATLSRPIITGVLRGELGFDGVVITDALTMDGVRKKYGDAEVAIRALEAGADILLMSPAPEAAYTAVLSAVRRGRLTEGRIDQSLRRILGLKWDRGIVADPLVEAAAVPATVGTPAHLARAQEITDRTTTLLVDDGRLMPVATTGSVLVTGWGQTRVPMMVEAVKETGATADGIWTGADPTAADIAGVVAAARTHDVTVVLTHDLSLATGAGQRALVAALMASGRPVAVVAVQTPYDAAYVEGAGAVIATYSYTRDALRAAARVLVGTLRPTGRLPVSIPDPADPTKDAFAFGFGLTR